MTEDQIIEQISKQTSGKTRHVTLGIGDDCAIYAPQPSEELLFTTDFLIEDVHFTRNLPPAAVGQRALTRSLSDIAAMGGTPRFCLVALALPEWAGRQWIRAFYRGLLQLAEETGTDLAGGDFSRAGQLVCNITVCGSARRGKALRRSGARPGDWIYVSAPLGGWRYKSTPVARLKEGRKLLGKATSCIDLSDGLSLDLKRLCTASGCSAELTAIPLLPGATIEQALYDGEDYELLYTVPPRVRVAGHRIGTVIRGERGTVKYLGKLIPPLGYDHFRQRSR